MIYPSGDKIEKEIDSKYALVILAAKRARQIKEGGKSLIQTDSPNPITVALEEIAEGQIKPKFDESSLAGREALADAQAVIGAREIAVDHDPLPDDLELIAAARDALGGAHLDNQELQDFGEEEGIEGFEEEEDEEEDPLLVTEEDADINEI
jgi:DNA-directed RNA polymerase subunit omega